MGGHGHVCSWENWIPGERKSDSREIWLPRESWLTGKVDLLGKLTYRESWLLGKVDIPGKLTSWKIWLSENLTLPGNLTSREIWYPGKIDFWGKSTFWGNGVREEGDGGWGRGLEGREGWRDGVREERYGGRVGLEGREWGRKGRDGGRQAGDGGRVWLEGRKGGEVIDVSLFDECHAAVSLAINVWWHFLWWVASKASTKLTSWPKANLGDHKGAELPYLAVGTCWAEQSGAQHVQQISAKWRN